MTKEDIRLQEMLVTLRTRLLVMCAEASIALENTQQALNQKDIGKATAVIEGDIAINALENEIDERALCILVRSQPMAKDLRFVISALSIVSDLERIGDEAVSIAEHAMLMRDVQAFDSMDDVLHFMASVRAVFDATVEAFRNNDVKKAEELSQGDLEALQEEVRVLQRVMSQFGDKAQGLDSQVFMHLILVVHSLTRIWQRSVNIAEQVYFYLEGVSLKHRDHMLEKK